MKFDSRHQFSMNSRDFHVRGWKNKKLLCTFSLHGIVVKTRVRGKNPVFKALDCCLLVGSTWNRHKKHYWAIRSLLDFAFQLTANGTEWRCMSFSIFPTSTQTTTTSPLSCLGHLQIARDFHPLSPFSPKLNLVWRGLNSNLVWVWEIFSIQQERFLFVSRAF